MLKDFLMHFGLDEHTAEEDTCKIEHVLNPKTARTLEKFIEFMDREEESKIWIDHFRYLVISYILLFKLTL